MPAQYERGDHCVGDTGALVRRDCDPHPAKAYALPKRGSWAQLAASSWFVHQGFDALRARREPIMRRLVLITCLAALMTAGAVTTAHASLVAGIGDQNASTFSDPNFK